MIKIKLHKSITEQFNLLESRGLIVKDRDKALNTLESLKDLPFVKHHISVYGGNLPIWVAVEIMTMGNIHKLYNNLKCLYQKQIAKIYNTGIRQLMSWIENLTYTRNHLAHYMRIYGYNFGRIPVSCSNHTPVTQSGRIFDQIMIIGFMFSSKTEWNNYIVPEIAKIVSKYESSIVLQDIGFPTNWKDILTNL